MVAGNLIHAKAQDEGTGTQTQTTGPEGNVKVSRLMGAIEYGRPLAQHWNGTLGVNFQRANCLDDHNQPMTKASTHHSPALCLRPCFCKRYKGVVQGRLALITPFTEHDLVAWPTVTLAFAEATLSWLQPTDIQQSSNLLRQPAAFRQGCPSTSQEHDMPCRTATMLP